MKHLFYYLLFSGLVTHPTFSQSILNVSHQPVGNKIIINYDLTEVSAKQLFAVSVYSSLDNYQKPLKNLSGNGIGDEIKGSGKKTIIWDVFKDREELNGLISFEVRALVTNSDENNFSSGNFKVLLVNSKTDAYNVITNTLEDFLNQVKDVKDGFELNADANFNNRQAHEALIETIKKYNIIYEKLNQQRPSYEKWIDEYWKNEVTTSQVGNLLDYALGDVHRVSVLTLNQYVQEMNSDKIRKSKKEREILIRDIQQESLQLSKKIELLEDRKTKVLNLLNKK